MKNREIVETYNVLNGLIEEKGFSLKFQYNLARMLKNLKNVVDSLQQIQLKPVEGQEEYAEARQKLLEKHSRKNENGRAQMVQTANGVEYDIEDPAAFEAKMTAFRKKHKDVIASIEARNVEFLELYESECEDFIEYRTDVKHLPVRDGELQLTTKQLQVLLPFLDGDIDDLDI